MKKLFLFLLLTFGAANLTTAQETALSVLFYNYQDAGSTQGLMKNNSSYSDWEFNNYCIDLKGTKYFFKVGDGTNNGVFATPALNLNGNATLLIKTSGINGSAKFRVSIEGEGKVGNADSQEFTIPSTSTFRPSAIYISGCTPSSKIKIEGVSGSFKVLSMKVYSIYDATFYESFDYMASNGMDDFATGEDASSSNCDNIESTLSNVSQANYFVYLSRSSSIYQTPSLNVSSGNNYILSFKLAKANGGSNNPNVTISCTGSAKLSPINSTSLNSTVSSTTISFSDKIYKQWDYFFVTITGISNTTQIQFSGSYIYLDDVMLTPMPTGLSQSTDNSLFMRIYDQQTMDVQITRTLTPNVWCPLCLPFDVTPELMAQAVGSCELCTLSGISERIFSFNDVTEGTIEAGKPFLVKVATQVVDPVFHNVTISNTAAKTVTFDGADGYKLVGTYSPVTLNTDGTHLFLGTDGMLYKPGTEAGYNRLGGLRAYFEIPSSAASSTRVDINDNSNAIITLSAETVTSTGTFDLQGRRMPQGQLRQGLYISNGRKVLVR